MKARMKYSGWLYPALFSGKVNTLRVAVPDVGAVALNCSAVHGVRVYAVNKLLRRRGLLTDKP